MAEGFRTGWSSGIDGTAVELAPHKFSLRNALRYPLSPAEGFVDFFYGVNQAGVPFRNFISSRSDIRPRNAATRHSLAQMDLGRNYPFIHAGTLQPFANDEKLKASRVIQAAEDYTIFGFIDDRPHRIGHELINLLTGFANAGIIEGVDIVLGAVAQKDGDYLAELEAEFDRAARNQPDLVGRYSDRERSSLTVGNSRLHVLEIEELTFYRGAEFGKTITYLAL